jgi:hypothetical protein
MFFSYFSTYIIIFYSEFGWLLAKKPRCWRYYSTWSHTISKWHPSSSGLCPLKKTQVWSLFRCSKTYIHLNYLCWYTR